MDSEENPKLWESGVNEVAKEGKLESMGGASVVLAL